MRTITVELVTPTNLDIRSGWVQQEKLAQAGRGVFRPLTQREWDRIERRVVRGRQVRRKPVGIRNAPRPQLADGRFVDDVLNSRTYGRWPG